MTVKPVALMMWLIELVTPPGGKVLDPFLGSGTTAMAAELLGVDWVGIERSADYLPIAEARTRWARAHRGRRYVPPVKRPTKAHDGQGSLF